MSRTARLSTVLALCTAAAAPAFAFDQDKLVIWMGANRGAAQLAEVGQRFEEELGIAVEVLEVEPLAEKFQQAASTGDGPDIVLWAHDRFGEWASGGLLAPVQPTAAFRDGVLDTGFQALDFDGKTWGFPVGLETATLVWNRDLIEAPPATFEDIASMELPDGIAPILWDYTNAYFTFGLMMANGGYAFEKVDGSYDGTRTGVNNEGAIAGAQALAGLIESGAMPTGVDYGVMDSAMNKGDVAMVINGPWAWAALAASGIDFAVAPVPPVDGAAVVPFVGVLSAGINAATPNADLAVEFLENYALTDEGLATWNANSVLGGLADVSAAAEQADENVAAMLEVAADGVPMPSNPEMGAFWAAMEPALANITTGAQSPEAALDDAAARILGD